MIFLFVSDFIIIFDQNKNLNFKLFFLIDLFYETFFIFTEYVFNFILSTNGFDFCFFSTYEIVYIFILNDFIFNLYIQNSWFLCIYGLYDIINLNMPFSFNFELSSYFSKLWLILLCNFWVIQTMPTSFNNFIFLYIYRIYYTFGNFLLINRFSYEMTIFFIMLLFD